MKLLEIVRSDWPLAMSMTKKLIDNGIKVVMQTKDAFGGELWGEIVEVGLATQPLTRKNAFFEIGYFELDEKTQEPLQPKIAESTSGPREEFEQAKLSKQKDGSFILHLPFIPGDGESV